jgi:hypothetical protein
MYFVKFYTVRKPQKFRSYVPSPMRNENGLHVLVSDLVALLKLGLEPLFFKEILVSRDHVQNVEFRTRTRCS